MKLHVRITMLALLTITIACKESKKTDNSNEVVKDDMVEEVTAVVSKAKNSASQLDILAETTPMSQLEYQDWLPKTVFNIPLVRNTVNDHAEIPEQGILAVYESGKRNIELRLIDMVGSQAQLFAVYQNTIGKEYHNREEKTHYRKAVKKQGYLANETHDYGGDRMYSFLQFIHDDRYLVSIKANGFSPDAIWNDINEFNFNKLK